MKNKIIAFVLFTIFILLGVLIKLDLLVTIDNLMYKIITIRMNDYITYFYKFITFLGSTEFIIFLCVFFLILFFILKKQKTGVIIPSVLLFSTIVNSIIKILFGRSRPDVLKLVLEESYSFPSGHTMAAVSMYGILIYIVNKSNINKKLKIILSIILGIIPLLVALSRVYLGAHYITDVIGAIILATGILLIEIYIIDKNEWL